MTLDPQDAARVEKAFDDAQARVNGPLMGVLAQASSNYETMPVVASALAALIAPWPLLLLTQLSAQRIFIVQLLVFLCLLALLSLTPLGRAMTPGAVRRANAHRAALGQFMVRGVDRSAARSGVLVYVSLAERYVRIVPDDGAAAAIPPARWQPVVDAMIAKIKAGAVADGLCEAATRCADLLSAEFPASPSAPPRPRQQFHLV